MLGHKNSTKIERTFVQKLDKVDKDELMVNFKGLNREMKGKGKEIFQEEIYYRLALLILFIYIENSLKTA